MSQDKDYDFFYTNKIRSELRKSLRERFGDLIKDDLFLLSTFLDSNFGLDYFDSETKIVVKQKVKNLVLAVVSSKNNNEEKVQSKISNNKATRVEQLRQSNYISHKEVNTEIEIDDVDKMIDEYVRTVSENKFTCTLNFWKTYESIYPSLAKLAKKYLSVPASSAAVERMFSISGHIFSIKRRRLGIKYLTDLVYLKLNELFM